MREHKAIAKSLVDEGLLLIRLGVDRRDEVCHHLDRGSEHILQAMSALLGLLEARLEFGIKST